MFTESDLTGVLAQSGRFPLASFQKVEARGADLSGSDLTCTPWTEARCHQTNFSGANLSFADFSHADLSGAILQRASLGRAHFHRAKEATADFSGSTRSLARPDDPERGEAEDFQPRSIE